MSDIILTIAIPSIPSRIRMNLEPLFSRLMTQIGSRKDVEVISLLDNKSMSIASKRKKLLDISRGKFCTFLDDDDDFAPSYIDDVTSAIVANSNVDVICYNQQAFIENVEYLVTTDIDAPINPFDQLPTTPRDKSGNFIPCRRPPWIWCAWNVNLLRSIDFGDSSFGEDANFIASVMPKVKTQFTIPKPLHIYRWSSTTTSVTAPWSNH